MWYPLSPRLKILSCVCTRLLFSQWGFFLEYAVEFLCCVYYTVVQKKRANFGGL